MKRFLHATKFLRHGSACVAAVGMLASLAGASELRVPSVVEAGQGFAIATTGAGQATFYLVGPDHVAKQGINLGEELKIQAHDVHAAGQYQVILCDLSCTSATFEVKAAPPAHLSFFLHPSRVPVSTRDAIDATAFVFDPYFNLVLSPSVVDFQSVSASGTSSSRPTPTRNGVASMRTDSTTHEGPVRVKAIVNNVVEMRVVQQVASEACGLRMKTIQTGSVVSLETDPIRDCGGNTLPDGTVVSFTKIDKDGRSTVDTPIKKGVARATFKVDGPARISIACGVVLGNEIALGGKS
jgi:hypothetical protein